LKKRKEGKTKMTEEANQKAICKKCGNPFLEESSFRIGTTQKYRTPFREFESLKVEILSDSFSSGIRALL
jgi:hypothetical protein